VVVNVNRRLAIALAIIAAVAFGAGAVAGAARADPVVAMVGDAVCAPGPAPTTLGCQYRAVSDLIVRRWNRGEVTRVLGEGDLQYDRGALADYQAAYDASYGRFKSITCPAPGNHEYLTAAAAGYYAYWGGQAFRGGHTCSIPGAPNWTVVGLDSGPDLGCSWDAWQSGGTTLSCLGQTDYLRDALARLPTCELAYWHHPRWSAETDDSPRVQPFLDAFAAGHGELIGNGHAHAFESFYKQNAAGTPDPTNGFRMLVSGTGGVDLRPFDRTPARASRTRISAFGAVFVTLHPASYDWRFIDVNGVTRDQVLGEPCRA
jgi:hypothetical protein